MSEISALQTALSALRAQRLGLDVTGHNIANAGTEGYSRQRVEMVAELGPTIPAIHARWAGAGMGVDVRGIRRVADALLGARVREERATLAAMSRKDVALGRVEQIFDEPSDRGIQNLLADFWSAWHDVVNRPGDATVRMQVLERARALTHVFNAAAAELDALERSVSDELDTLVNEVNAIATSVAHLNATIRTAHGAGLPHEDLLDRRDLLLRDLADRVGATVRSLPDGSVDLFVGGRALVRGGEAEQLAIAGTTVVWARGGAVVHSVGGAIGGLLETISDIVPRYQNALDHLTGVLRDTVNFLHAGLQGEIPAGAQDLSSAGVMSFALSINGGAPVTISVIGADWSGAGGSSALQSALQTALDTATGTPGAVVASVSGGAGTALSVTLTPASPSDTVTVSRIPGNDGLAVLLSEVQIGADGVGGRAFFAGSDAATFVLSPLVMDNPQAVGAALSNGGPLDARGAQRIAALADDPASVDHLYRAFVVSLGVERQNSARRLATQADVTDRVEEVQSAESGVNLDEEMVNMIMFQHAYAAAARYMTALDEMLGTLIERTGLSGR